MSTTDVGEYTFISIICIKPQGIMLKGVEHINEGNVLTLLHIYVFWKLL